MKRIRTVRTASTASKASKARTVRTGRAAALAGGLPLLAALALFAVAVGPAAGGPDPGGRDRDPAAGPDGAAGAAAEYENSAAVVRASLQPARLTARPGREFAFAVDFTIAGGWHLYAHGDTTFYGIALAGLEGTPLAAARIAYPAGEKADFFGTPVALLHGRQSVRVAGTLPADTPPGARELALTLEVQACDDQRCLAPARLPLTLRLDVPKPGK